MTDAVRPATSDAFPRLVADRGILFGGDYNPEQWPREVWREDVELMQRAGVNLVTVGVFSWSTLEPHPGAREWAWLDEILDLLHAHGIAVDLATPTASPPPWMGTLHPETLPVTRDGVRLSPGSRNQFAPSAGVYRAAAVAIARDLAERYASHPAVRMWHVGNEYGQIDFGPEAARAFRTWLRARYGSIDALNEAWSTRVWSQGYRDFDDIVPPRTAPYLLNPAATLDFHRFTSDELRDCFREQRDAIRSVGATQPITTNLMGFFDLVDGWSWAPDLDVVSDDQYPDPALADSSQTIALVQDLTRSLGGGRPWMLMEQAASAVSWRPHNLPKSPARMRLDSLQAVARGADGVCFFQWRQARAGAERFHSSMLPHAGADSDAFRGIERLGADLAKLRGVTGGRVEAPVAILFDWQGWWAAKEPARPTERHRTLEQLERWHAELWRRGIGSDLVRPGADLAGYRAVLVPHSYILEPDAAAALERAAAAGTRIVVGPFSGVADAHGAILQGRSPVPIRDLVGVSGEEWVGLPDSGVALSDGSRAQILAERLRTDGAEVLASYAEGDLAGRPAVTRHGDVWYLGTVTSDALLARVLDQALEGIEGALGTQAVPAGLEAVRRGDALFLLNHADSTAQVAVPEGSEDLLTGHKTGPTAAIAPGEAMVLIERRTK
ncbi:beta-galactosidase [Microbacterium phosphatis]|uniref:beta-galactosidase n=1 Tax=Microbacterium phosphatis TaxID=3140248 RepID=UPI0031403FCB